MNRKNTVGIIALLVLILGVVLLGCAAKKKRGGWVKEQRSAINSKSRCQGSKPAQMMSIPEPDTRLPSSPPLPPLSARL